MSFNNTLHKKRVTITINPFIYNNVLILKQPFSRVVEMALEKYLEHQKQTLIKENLLKRSKDKDCQKEDLKITKDFFNAEL